MGQNSSIRTAVWGSGNVGRAAIRAVDAHPDLELAHLIVHSGAKIGRDAGDLAGMGRDLDVAAIADVETVLSEVDAVGTPRIAITVEAIDEDGNRAAGGNATAVGRLVNAIGWLHASAPGLYDALDVPLSPAVGKLTRKAPA